LLKRPQNNENYVRIYGYDVRIGEHQFHIYDSNFDRNQHKLIIKYLNDEGFLEKPSQNSEKTDG
jgi:hypothetical protein